MSRFPDSWRVEYTLFRALNGISLNGVTFIKARDAEHAREIFERQTPTLKITKISPDVRDPEPKP